MPAGSSQDEVQPCIRELLRTCHYPPLIRLRIERVLEETVNENHLQTGPHFSDSHEARTGFRLLLSDGEWMVNATLHKGLRGLIQDRSLIPGAVLAITKLTLRRASRSNGQGKVVYLAISDCSVDMFARSEEENLAHARSIGAAHANTRYPLNAHNNGPHSPSQDSVASYDSAELSLLREMEEPFGNSPCERSRHATPDDSPRKRKLDWVSPHRSTSPSQYKLSTPSKQSGLRMTMNATSESEDSDDDDFETAVTNEAVREKRRQVLHELGAGNSPSERPKNQVDPQNPLGAFDPRQMSTSNDASNKTSALISDLSSLSTKLPAAVEEQSDEVSPPLHTLSSLIAAAEPLPQKNYRCSVFGVISWVSPSLIKRPGFSVKRHIKIHDQTIGDRYSGISISIFLDAEHFVPETGTVALFRCVRAQWWEKEVILNAYESDCRDKDWFVTDRKKLELEGLDVQGLSEWWEKRQARLRNRIL
ncbi:MAG: hypothetical protein Q9227_005478 [Pyrenula ochraceoflavens]